MMEAASFHILLFLCVLAWPLLNIHSLVGDQWCSALNLLPFHQVTVSKPDILALPLLPVWPTLLFLSANQWLHWSSVPTHPPAVAFFIDNLTLEDETTVLSSSGAPIAQ